MGCSGSKGKSAQIESWDAYLDLQCPYSKKVFVNLAAMQAEFGIQINYHLTALSFHPQAFEAMCATRVILNELGKEAYDQYVAILYADQTDFMNGSTADTPVGETKNIFADLAAKAGLLDEKKLSRAAFLEKISDWNGTIKPAYAEHKEAVALAVYGTPKHVINNRLVPDTESSWGPQEWRKHLAGLQGNLPAAPPAEAKADAKSWQVFLDLQCPYSKATFENLPAIRAAHESKFAITTHLTSLTFHRQAFAAQCAAKAVMVSLGADAEAKFIAAMFSEQKLYMNAAAKSLTRAQITEVFADIANRAGLFADESKLTRAQFIEKCGDWNAVIKPTYADHKFALVNGVTGTPSHVIGGRKVEGAESAWGAEEWGKKLASLDA